MTITDLEKRVVDAAVYAVCGSGSITAECRRDAAVLVLVWAKASGLQEFDELDIDSKTEEAYRHFEFSEPEPKWAIFSV